MGIPGSRDDRGLDPEQVSTSEPRARLEFHSRSFAEPFRAELASEVTVDIGPIVTLPTGNHLQFWTVSGGTARGVVEAASMFPTILDARLLATNDDHHRVEVLGAEESLFSAIHTFGGVPQELVFDGESVRFVADFPLPLDTDAVESRVQEVYSGLELVSTTEVQPIGVVQTTLGEAFTDRQLTALQLAYHGGYFEQPRQSTGAELADRMGISKQAFHEHLRKAYRVVFEQFFEADGGWRVDS
ncbi:helix-turn-helix domain-containing protein [Haloarchaeobius litoreus]|uniref:Helix-turn-helix domain-containing protein n=1 Tax=Haloarchaeobius litoreus TaxID=755306 RepID=A0ABD6DHB9_9EURY|nr:bacterio-opsin activator domain-containing protein [Haloarchaeobius litoreus]